jgi:hypothetical protein
MPSPWEFRLLELTTSLRTWLLEQLSDEDLAFALPGNPTLGELCVAIGNTEHAYADAYGTRRLSWAARNEDPALARSVAGLQVWYAALDADLLAAIKAIPDDEFASAVVIRGDGFEMPLPAHFHTYREALIIFCGHADVYLRAMGKARSEHWEDWIG